MNFIFFLGLPFLLLLSNCARDIASGSYSEGTVGSVKKTYRGVVISVRPVKIEGHDSLGDNQAGLLGGGLAGGLLGSQMGKGKGQVVGAVLGAAAGAVGGAFLEKGLKKQDGLEYVVELNNGTSVTVVQGPDHALSVGQRVLVIVDSGRNGRSRVVLDTSPLPVPVVSTSASAEPFDSEKKSHSKTVVIVNND